MRRNILQVFEVGTATMMSPQGRDHAGGYQVMKQAGEKFDPSGYVPAVAGYYTSAQGPDAALPVQQLDHGLLLQQGRVREGRPRSGTNRR